jgi:apolipoprotein N-acyltransferase
MFDMTIELMEEGSKAYIQTTKRALEALEGKPADVLVWPESIYTQGSPTIIWDQGPLIPPELMVERSQLLISVHGAQLAQDAKLAALRRASGGSSLPNLLMGTDVFSIVDGKLDRYNAALWIPNEEAGTSEGSNPNAGNLDYYAKQHLVMFGEYIPVLSWFPSVMQSIGMGTLSVGKEAKSWRLKSGRRITTNVCFEDVVPHLMQRQLRELKKRGESPDVMINISNDGWFHGSSILNHHLNSAIVTAVENRIPVLVASNTGISAWIDGDGRVIEQLPKLQGGWIIAEPIPDGREGLWSWWGDKPAWAITCIGLFPCMRWFACRLRRRSKSR